jgi:acyl phosphate:glycerol-3-phosphate acyltransferase
MDWRWPLAVLAGYLCGSIPFGLFLGYARGVDIRASGSGNLGATNVGRVLGKKWGILCFALDVLKGFAPVFVAGWWLGYIGRPVDGLTQGEAWRWLAVAAAAVIGHCFPVWLGFKGGKGVATSFGVLLGLWPFMTLPGLAALATWVVTMKLSRYVSLASMVAAVALPVFVVTMGMWRGQPGVSLLPFVVVAALRALLVVWRHRTNIQRLMAGTENKVGVKHE